MGKWADCRYCLSFLRNVDETGAGQGRKKADGSSTAGSPETGGDWDLGRRHCSRLQQSSHGHPGKCFSPPHESRPLGAIPKKVENIERQIESGAKLTSLLLGYARKGRYEVKSIDFNRLTEEVSETFFRTKKDVADSPRAGFEHYHP